MRLATVSTTLALASLLLCCSSHRRQGTVNSPCEPAEPTNQAVEERAPTHVPDPAPEARDAWELTGRIELVGDENFDLPKWFPLNGFEVTLLFEYPLIGDKLREWQEDEWHEPDEKPVGNAEFKTRIDIEGRFKIGGKEEALEWLDGAPPNTGVWSLQVDDYDNPQQTKASWGMGVSIIREIVARDLRPEVRQRTCSFGVIRVDFDALFPARYFVAGRLVDCDGNPLSRSWFSSLIATANNETSTYTFQTDAHGRFIENVWHEELAMLTGESTQWTHQYIHRLRAAEKHDALQPVTRPMFKGRVLYFGDIEIAAGVVRVRVKDNRPSVGPDAERWQKYVGGPEQAYFSVDCASYLSSPNLDVPYDGSECCVWLPEGIYQYRLLGGDYRSYVEQIGAITVRATGVVRLELALEPLPVVAVELVPDGALKYPHAVRATWTSFQGDRVIDQDSSGGLAFAIPLAEGQHAELIVQPGDYPGTRQVVHSGQPDIRIPLSKTSAGSIEVEYPAPPDGFALDDFDLQLDVLTGPFGQVISLVSEPIREDGLYQVQFTGMVRVGLRSKRDFGWYDWDSWNGASVTDAVEVLVRAGQTTKVVLKPMYAPTWQMWAWDRGPITLRCGDTVIDYATGSCVDFRGREAPGGVGGDQQWLSRNIAALRDGDALIPLYSQLPRVHGGSAKREVSLPVRIVLDLRPLIEAFDSPLTVEVRSSEDGHSGVRVSTRRAQVSLWAPPGTAHISVREGLFGAILFGTNVEVLGDSVAEETASLEAPDPESIRVQFDVPTHPEEVARYFSWNLYRRSDTEGIANVGTLTSNGTMALKPARYLAIHDSPHQPVVEFEVSGEAGQTIRLPQLVPARIGTIRLKFEVPEGMYVGSEVRADPIRGGAAFLRSTFFMNDDWRRELLTHRAVADGIKVFNYPLGCEMLVSGIVMIRLKGRDVLWLLHPTRVPASESGEEIQVSLVRGVPLKGFWKRNTVIADWIDGVAIRTLFEAVPIGTYTLEYTFLGRGGLISWSSTVAESDDFVKVPTDTNAQLRARFRELYGRDPTDD